MPYFIIARQKLIAKTAAAGKIWESNAGAALHVREKKKRNGVVSAATKRSIRSANRKKGQVSYEGYELGKDRRERQYVGLKADDYWSTRGFHRNTRARGIVRKQVGEHGYIE